VAELDATFNGLRPLVYGNAVGYLGLTLFSADAFVPSLAVCPPEAPYKLLTVFCVRMVDVLVNGLVAY